MKKDKVTIKKYKIIIGSDENYIKIIPTNVVFLIYTISK